MCMHVTNLVVSPLHMESLLRTKDLCPSTEICLMNQISLKLNYNNLLCDIIKNMAMHTFMQDRQ